MLEAAEEAPELRVRAHELRAAGHEQLEGVAQRLSGVCERQLRARIHHLVFQRLQLGPSACPKAAAPEDRGRGRLGPPPLHVAPHRRPLGAARALWVLLPPPPPPPASGSAAAAAAGAFRPVPLSLLFSPPLPPPHPLRGRRTRVKILPPGTRWLPAPTPGLCHWTAPRPLVSLSSPLSLPFALSLSLNVPALGPSHRSPVSTHWVLSEEGRGLMG